MSKTLPKKRDHRSSPEQMNSTPTNVPKAPTLPQTCAHRPWDEKAGSVASYDRTEPGAICRTSRVSEEMGGEETPATGVQVLAHLWALTG
jgi:hypothetical protein